jgi:hypothetical protein
MFILDFSNVRKKSLEISDGITSNLHSKISKEVIALCSDINTVYDDAMIIIQNE